ncbi:DUF6875 domain-containing protein [Plantactinospora siamensis]|uniref:DUF6875 domain-containing protein n=1 Tax=Plantactinospora siamensis TaxID=555372 RepID=A0ABV6NWT1_9ACTN
MLTHPGDPRRFLLGVDDLAPDRLPERAQPYGEPLRLVADWARRYLCRPHDELGRTGPVCPYVPTSLRKRLFYLTVQAGRPGGPDRAAVAAAVAAYRDWFRELPPVDGPAAQFKTILILFPQVRPADAPDIVDATQAELKPSFVAAGLMIGQFHPLPPVDGGLWNKDFRPLSCPVPLLAIRHMVPTDLPFLTHDRRLLDGYHRVFGDDLPPRQRIELGHALASVSTVSATEDRGATWQ